MSWFKSFIEHLPKVLEKPPYLIFLFTSAIFVVISLVTEHYFKETWAFFLYSAVGAMWRYIERDFFRPVEEYKNSKLLIISIYHVGNVGLVLALFLYLGYL